MDCVAGVNRSNYENTIIKAVAALICCMAACWTSIASAQEPVSVSGQVKDTNGNPIIGATVVVERTGAGTTSGVDGAFTIRCIRVMS